MSSPYFWRAKVRNQGGRTLALPPETLGDSPSHLFHLLGGSGSPWACGLEYYMNSAWAWIAFSPYESVLSQPQSGTNMSIDQ